MYPWRESQPVCRLAPRTLDVMRPETGRTLNCRIRRPMTFKRQTLTERVSLAPQTPPASSLRRRGRLLRRLPTVRYRTVRGTNAGQVLLYIEKALHSPSLLSRYTRAQPNGDLSAPLSCTGSLFRRSSFIHALRSHHRGGSRSRPPLPAPVFSMDPSPILPPASVFLPPTIHTIHSLSTSLRWAIRDHQVGNIQGRTAAVEQFAAAGRRGSSLDEPTVHNEIENRESHEANYEPEEEQD